MERVELDDMILEAGSAGNDELVRYLEGLQAVLRESEE